MFRATPIFFFSLFFFRMDSSRSLLRTINSRRCLRFIKATRTIYPIFVRHRCRIFQPCITPENVTNASYGSTRINPLPSRSTELSGIPKNVLWLVWLIWSNTRGIGNSGRMRKGENRSRHVSKILLTLFSNLLDATTEKTLIDIGGLKARSKALFFSFEVILTLT